MNERCPICHSEDRKPKLFPGFAAGPLCPDTFHNVESAGEPPAATSGLPVTGTHVQGDASQIVGAPNDVDPALFTPSSEPSNEELWAELKASLDKTYNSMARYAALATLRQRLTDAEGKRDELVRNGTVAVRGLVNLQTERDEARAHVAQLQSSLVDADFHTGMAMNETRALRAENAKLREALELAHRWVAFIPRSAEEMIALDENLVVIDRALSPKDTEPASPTES